MKAIWFRRIWVIYAPWSVTGWALTLLTLFICMRTFMAVDARSHSVSDTLLGAGPIIGLLTLLLWLLAVRSSDDSSPG